MKWDSSTCSLVTASAPSSGPWVATLRPAPTAVIGYATQSESVAVVNTANASIKAAVSAIGATYVFADYFYPDAADALAAAQSIATRKANVVISWNLLVPSMPTLMNVYKQICAPVIQISVQQPGTVFFGANNSDIGTKEGAGLATWAQSKGWTGSGTTVLGVTTPTLGASVNLRVSACISAIQSALPGVGTSSAQLSASTTDVGQTTMTTWLTANPTKKKVLVCTNADTAAFGIANAAKAANRGDQVGVGGVGGSANPGGSFVGTVDLGFKDYGAYLVPLAEDLEAGRAVPASVSPTLTFVTGS